MWNPLFINFQMIGLDIHAIHGIVEAKKFQFFLSPIYASTKFKARLETYNDLIEMSAYILILWVVMGDFNEVTCQSKKLEGDQLNKKRVENFNESMDRCGLVDVGCAGKKIHLA